MGDILNKTITITTAEEDSKRIKIKDERNLTYSIWKLKKDNTESMAYMLWQKMPNKFQTVEISYTETPGDYQGKAITYRSIIGFKGGNEIFHPAQHIDKKINNDKEMRESFVASQKDDVQQHIKWGLAWNCASRLISNAVDVKTKDDAIKGCEELAKEIYKRVQELPTDKVKEELEEDNSAIKSLVKEFGSVGDIKSQGDEINVDDIPF